MMTTGTAVWKHLTVALFMVAVSAPVLQQLIDNSTIQIQLVEEIPDSEKEKEVQDKEQQKDQKICRSHIHQSGMTSSKASCYSAEIMNSADHSTMPDPPPEMA